MSNGNIGPLHVGRMAIEWNHHNKIFTNCTYLSSVNAFAFYTVTISLKGFVFVNENFSKYVDACFEN